MKKTWQQTSQVFNDRAREYDSWFDDSLLYSIELAALKALSSELPGPRLEIGVGPGRFACALDIPFGIDPAFSALQLAARRNISVIAATGEQLPLATGSMGTLVMLFALCFLPDPEQVLRECYRALNPGGRVLLGFVPAGSAWGKALEEKKRQNHRYYRYADFKTIDQVKQLLQKTGFSLIESKTTLRQPPEEMNQMEQPQAGLDEGAGFCVLLAGKGKATP